MKTEMLRGDQRRIAELEAQLGEADARAERLRAALIRKRGMRLKTRMEAAQVF